MRLLPVWCAGDAAPPGAGTQARIGKRIARLALRGRRQRELSYRPSVDLLALSRYDPATKRGLSLARGLVLRDGRIWERKCECQPAIRSFEGTHLGNRTRTFTP